MISGSCPIGSTVEAVQDRLRLILAAANCEIIERGADIIRFRHGNDLSGNFSDLPKECEFRFEKEENGVRVNWSVSVRKPTRVFMIIWAMILFWAIFPPILARRALIHHPRRLVQNILAGL